MTTMKTRPSSEADALREELAAAESELEQVRRIQQAPRTAYRARQRAASIRGRLARLEREAEAERTDPEWRRKLDAAAAEYDAALADWQARKELRRQRGARQAPQLGAPVAGMPGARHAGATWLATEGPADIVASARLSNARRRLLQLREWPDVLTRQREYEASLRSDSPLARRAAAHASGRTERVEVINTAELVGDVTTPPELEDPNAERTARHAAFAERWNRRRRATS